MAKKSSAALKILKCLRPLFKTFPIQFFQTLGLFSISLSCFDVNRWHLRALDICQQFMSSHCIWNLFSVKTAPNLPSLLNWQLCKTRQQFCGKKGDWWDFPSATHPTCQLPTLDHPCPKIHVILVGLSQCHPPHLPTANP